MNVERILELADHIEALPDYDLVGRRFVNYGTSLPHEEVPVETCFRMRFTTHPCGAPACIAGWADHLWGDEYEGQETTAWDTQKIMARAMLALGLSREQAQRLFMPSYEHADYDASPYHYRYVNPARAAAQLRLLAKTGDVDWILTRGPQYLEKPA